MSVSIQTESDEYYNRVMALIRAVEQGTNPDGENVKTGLYAMSHQTATYASVITHRDTATLYHSYEVFMGKGYATIYIDPAVVNPRGERPALYGPKEFARGGSHDAFGRAFRYANPSIVVGGVEVILKGIKD